MPLKVLCCGGRDYSDAAAVAAALDYWPIEIIAHGAARGADQLVGEYAKNRGIPVKEFQADWAKNGKAAGPIRNAQMLKEFSPDVVVAFPGGAGTRDMTRRAEKAGVLVIRVS